MLQVSWVLGNWWLTYVYAVQNLDSIYWVPDEWRLRHLRNGERKEKNVPLLPKNVFSPEQSKAKGRINVSWWGEGVPLNLRCSSEPELQDSGYCRCRLVQHPQLQAILTLNKDLGHDFGFIR